jgi:hypothetical protein
MMMPRPMSIDMIELSSGLPGNKSISKIVQMPRHKQTVPENMIRLMSNWWCFLKLMNFFNINFENFLIILSFILISQNQLDDADDQGDEIADNHRPSPDKQSISQPQGAVYEVKYQHHERHVLNFFGFDRLYDLRQHQGGADGRCQVSDRLGDDVHNFLFTIFINQFPGYF